MQWREERERLGAQSSQDLVQRLSHLRGKSLIAAVELLGKAGDRRAVPALVGLLYHHEAAVRAVAASALAMLGGRRALNAVTRIALSEANEQARGAAVSALAFLFDEGGRFGMGPLDPRLAASYNQQRTRAQAFIDSARAACPKLPPIHFDFVNNGEINAYAFSSQGRYFIGVNDGILASLTFLFSRMLADRLVLPQIGDVSLEAEKLPYFTGMYPHAQRMIDSGTMLARPHGAERERFAHYLVVAFRRAGRYPAWARIPRREPPCAPPSLPCY